MNKLCTIFDYQILLNQFTSRINSTSIMTLGQAFVEAGQDLRTICASKKKSHRIFFLASLSTVTLFLITSLLDALGFYPSVLNRADNWVGAALNNNILGSFLTWLINKSLDTPVRTYDFRFEPGITYAMVKLVIGVASIITAIIWIFIIRKGLVIAQRNRDGIIAPS